jgi:hypothetical protein
MTLTIPVRAGVARSRISKIDVGAERGLNAEAVPLNVGAERAARAFALILRLAPWRAGA